jgi:16S rRNA (guanine527-N7)-methyltransferase
VQFESALADALPADVPNRDQLIIKANRHLEMILAANEYMNLTRITDPREAAIKHIFDCVVAWPFFRSATTVLDAGSGAGFPGVPLAVVFPETRFLLSESTQKKARFLDSVVEELDLPNAAVYPQRAEEIAAAYKPALITARAVAPVERLVQLFRPYLKAGVRLLLYKGPEVEAELKQLGKNSLRAEIVHRYSLPDEMGSRTLIEISHRR